MNKNSKVVVNKVNFKERLDSLASIGAYNNRTMLGKINKLKKTISSQNKIIAVLKDRTEQLEDKLEVLSNDYLDIKHRQDIYEINLNAIKKDSNNYTQITYPYITPKKI